MRVFREHAAEWRRGRDSNPRRAFDPYTLSRGAPSTTRPPLHACGGKRTGQGLRRQIDELVGREGLTRDILSLAPTLRFGAPSLKLRRPKLHAQFCRTLEGLLTLTPLAGVRLRPLGHLSTRAAASVPDR